MSTLCAGCMYVCMHIEGVICVGHCVLCMGELCCLTIVCTILFLYHTLSPTPTPSYTAPSPTLYLLSLTTPLSSLLPHSSLGYLLFPIPQVWRYHRADQHSEPGLVEGECLLPCVIWLPQSTCVGITYLHEVVV